MRERLINRSQQGDLGEASAIEWLTGIGATVLIPVGRSPHFDLVAEVRGQLLRFPVKTSTSSAERVDGTGYAVQLATCGGNQSWNGVSKHLDPARVDYVFALVGDGRRWVIPVSHLEAQTTLRLGGSKYSEYEIPRGAALESFVYGADSDPSTIAGPVRGSAEAGESGWTVNPVPRAEWVRIPPPPSASTSELGPRASGRSLRYQRTTISPQHQITVPSVPFADAGLGVGDRLHATADGPAA